MPIYNEKNTIQEIIKRINNVSIEKEIIAIDDFSTDGTREILEKQKGNPLKLILHPENRGKGSAIRTGLKYVTGDIVIIQDADLEYSPDDYPKLIKPIIDGKSTVVYGSRVLDKSQPIGHKRYYFGGLLITWVTNFLYNTRLTDEPTCYKVFKADVLKSIKLKCKRFEFCPEVTAKILKKGIDILEIPISYNPRRMKEGKKIRWKDGLIALWILIKSRVVNE